VKIRYPKNKEEVLKLVNKWIEKLVNKFSIHSVILFGSYAKGTYTYGSDTDILLIFNEELSFEQVMSLALAVSLEIDWQIHLYSLDDFNKGLSNKNAFFNTILKDGLVLFEKR
jgi:predicted nucleotidyltransferase